MDLGEPVNTFLVIVINPEKKGGFVLSAKRRGYPAATAHGGFGEREGGTKSRPAKRTVEKSVASQTIWGWGTGASQGAEIG